MSKPLTIEEINLMPMSYLIAKDFERIDVKRLKYSNYSYERLTTGVPKAEQERILSILSQNDARWYWIWIRRGLEPDKALRKVQVDNASQRRELRKKKIELALSGVIYARPSHQSSP